MPKFTCADCGYKQEVSTGESLKQILAAAKVNGNGPYCEMCRGFRQAWNAGGWRGLSPEGIITAFRHWTEVVKEPGGAHG